MNCDSSKLFSLRCSDSPCDQSCLSYEIYFKQNFTNTHFLCVCVCVLGKSCPEWQPNLSFHLRIVPCDVTVKTSHTKLISIFMQPETPLTLAAVSSRPGPLLLALVGGGALIDYRTRCGSTALHRAAEKNSLEAVRTLLDLGASPNVRDAKGLTPLWTAVSAKASPMLCQALLHDYSIHGVQDAQGWHEVHQVSIFLTNSKMSSWWAAPMDGSATVWATVV